MNRRHEQRRAKPQGPYLQLPVRVIKARNRNPRNECLQDKVPRVGLNVTRTQTLQTQGIHSCYCIERSHEDWGVGYGLLYSNVSPIRRLPGFVGSIVSDESW